MNLATLGRLVLRVGVTLVALALAVAAGFAAQAFWRLPDLQPWHTQSLAQEFHARDADAPKTFDAYLAREAQVFAELRDRFYAGKPVTSELSVERYAPGSLSAKLALEGPGNRSADLPPDGPVRGAVVLLHGLTDAPYSLHAVGAALHARGFHVVALRLPGHGTVPGALVDIAWEDWLAAATLAIRHAAAKAGPGRPLYVAGYSTGAPVALLYALRAIDDAELPAPTRLLLFSPAIGISKFAVMTNVASLFAFVPGLQKARWLDVLPEFDPYKYNSFPVNAGNQVWSLTRTLERALADASASGKIARLPPILAFQSLVDSTVLAVDVERRLFERLPANRGDELVVFDVNRTSYIEPLIASGPRHAFEDATSVPALPFRLTVVGNLSADTREAAERIRDAGSQDIRVLPLGLAWPPGVFSLGHIAIPMPIDDPLYGLEPPVDTFNLGARVPRGEAGAATFPLGMFARIRSNPFFPVIAARIEQAVAADLAK